MNRAIRRSLPTLPWSVPTPFFATHQLLRCPRRFNSAKNWKRRLAWPPQRSAKTKRLCWNKLSSCRVRSSLSHRLLGRGALGQPVRRQRYPFRPGAIVDIVFEVNPGMDFDQLEIFLEVARLSSFSRAAEKRFRTQPAISSQIRALGEAGGASP